MKEAEWFAIASARGSFCGRLKDRTPSCEDEVHKPQPIDHWDAAKGRFITVWSDTGLPYDERKAGGGR